MTTTTGAQLRAERAAAYIEVKAVAAEMGVHRNTIVAIERRPEVRPEQAQKYREAIARLTKVAA